MKNWPFFKQSEYDDSITCKLFCSCGSDNCTQTYEINFDKDNVLSFTIYGNVSTLISGKNKLTEFLKRFYYSLKLLFTGSLEMSSEVILTGEHSIKEMVKELNKIMQQVQDQE